MKTALVLLGLFVASSAAAQCRTSDVEVKLKRFYDEGGYRMKYRVIGELVNRCSQPAGAQVRFVGRDKKGEIVNVAEFWPASVKNIPAGGSYPFSLFAMNYDPAIKTMDAEVIDVRQWR